MSVFIQWTYFCNLSHDEVTWFRLIFFKYQVTVSFMCNLTNQTTLPLFRQNFQSLSRPHIPLFGNNEQWLNTNQCHISRWLTLQWALRKLSCSQVPRDTAHCLSSGITPIHPKPSKSSTSKIRKRGVNTTDASSNWNNSITFLRA